MPVMPHHRFALSAAAVTVLVTAAALLTAPAAAARSADRTVEFDGVSVQVPASWPVRNVDGVPGCVRYDEHAVYLGEPSESTCPARIIGRTSTVQILRGPASQAAPRVTVTGAAGDLQISAGGDVRVVVTSDPNGATVARSVAASAVLDGTTVGVAAVSAAVAAGAPAQQPAPTGRLAPQTTRTAPSAQGATTSTASIPASVYVGRGFDACTAPSVKTMQAWHDHSPYRALGVYVGGVNRGCGQPNLTADWVETVHAQGWRLLPLYVGLQAPCSTYQKRISSTIATATGQGKDAAADAAAQMTALGLGSGNPVYLDMEGWNHNNTTCSAAVMAFADGWTAGLHAAGYQSGFYSSANYGIPALADTVQNDSSFHAPDAIWFARWDGNASTADTEIPSGLWANHRRIKQYLGGHNETYGGVTINIDSDYVDSLATGTIVDLSPLSLPDAFPGNSYRASLSGSGGQGPYTFTISSGSLPSGLKMSGAGTIYGTTTLAAAGTISRVTIQVSDSASPADTATQTYGIYTSYTDMPTGQTFYPTVRWLTGTGITYGYPDGTFKPAAGVSRGAMAAFLYRYTHPHSPTPQCKTAPFPDVPVGSKFCGHIAWLKSTGITYGYPDGKFHAEAMVTRGAMAAFLFRFTHPGQSPAKCTTKPFPDIALDSPFCGHITWLVNAGITVGYPDGDYHADAAVTRGAMSAFLSRLSRL